MNKPLILVSNDDGITSKGIRTLVTLMSQIGEVMVVAPDSAQSGMGHAITIGDTLRLTETDIFEGIQAFTCSGTPADCVKIAKQFVHTHRKPDLVVSGINHGSNTSISVLYSGTMSAAIEAAIEGMPAIGFSLGDYHPDANMSHIEDYVVKIATRVLKEGLAAGVALNVNFPRYDKGPIKGIKVCRQARAKWQEEFDKRKDPRGQSYYWLTGKFVNFDQGEDNDEWAIKNNYVSVVPCLFDLTAYNVIDKLSGWED